MKNWSKAESVYRNPDRLPAESSSVHRYRDRWVIWFNDYRPTGGDFRAVYALSDNPLKFDPKKHRVFKFKTSLPTKYADDDWTEKRPIPVSIELLEKGEDIWLVTYFRWHIDRFRMFVGAIHWDSDPAEVEEILTPERLKEVFEKVKKA